MRTTPTADVELAARLRLAVTRLNRRLRQQADANVTPSAVSALASISRAGSPTLGELATTERVQPPTMTRIVAALEESGLVARETDSKDRRIARVRLTPDGERFLKRSRTRKDAYLARKLRRLTPGEVAVLDAALPILDALMEEDA